MRYAPITLIPQRDVEQRGSGFEAMSAEPWLTIDDPQLLAAAGGFVEIVYRASLWDEPMRPLFRFETAGGDVSERIAAGPVAGAGIWIGRVPPGTLRVSVSPTLHPGPFQFVIETIARRSWPSLLALGLRRNPRSARSAILTRLIGWRPESDINLAWAIGSEKVTDYVRWLDKRRRPLDLAGLDAPRFDWDSAAPVHLWIDAREGAIGLDATLQALQAQVFEHWTATIVTAAPLRLPDDPRINQADRVDSSLITEGLIASLYPGDQLLPHALAYVAETARRHPDCSLFYGDEQAEVPGGLLPVFKPGWSPSLQRQQPFLGRAVFLRTSAVPASESRRAFVGSAAISDALLEGLTETRVKPLRRVLMQTRARSTRPPPTRSEVVGTAASITIVIPTRDQPARLGRSIESIRAFPGSRRPDILVIDNGSVAAETKLLFDTLRQSDDVRVIEHPGAFNFSLKCNEGAARSEADVLVFLNDDTQALSPDWLDRLAHWAIQPNIGAVGARLSYPDGRLQHIGVLVGMGESAGHFGAFAAPDDLGWADRHDVVHEVSAVTGACLAVARVKFQAVGGFDADHLPIELSDIDLCLKLSERGWRTIVDPAIRLLHEESASRGGATFRRSSLYESQRAYFKQRWRNTLRDDPFFHPGLSLFNWAAALA